MNKVSTSTWGYKIVSENQVNFYHILLPKVNIDGLTQKIPSIQYIKQQKDGSITISFNPAEPVLATIDKIVEFFTQKEENFLDTSNSTYTIAPRTRHLLRQWALSFQGCIAIMLTNNPKISPFITPSWHFINSSTGGLYLPPFTLFFYKDHPKVIHPVSVANYEERKIIEQTAASIIRKAIKHIEEAQPGMEGIALLSLVMEKTKLSQKEITTLINEKTFGVKSPSHSPLFTE